MFAKVRKSGEEHWIFSRDGNYCLRTGSLTAEQLFQGEWEDSEVIGDLDHHTYLPPLFATSRIFCVGRNYRDHSLEMGGEPPANPSIFTRFPESYVGHNGITKAPEVSEQYDYEGELVVVLASGGRNLTEAQAVESIGGLTLAMDGSVRDFQQHSLFAGKNFEASGALGPWIVPINAAAELSDILLETRIDGELRQQGCPKNFIFSVPQLIAYLSRILTLRPGDFISTGTPAGVGAGFSPSKWLVGGTQIMVGATGIPPLSVTVG